MSLKDKNVLITGIDGFVGSEMAKKLNKTGANVFGISKARKAKNVYKKDITNYKSLDILFKKLKIQICFHLAGISLVEQGQKNPYETFNVNTLGAVNILELTRIYKLERLIVASTAHVYGNNTPPFKESYFPRASRPYETSKATADLIAQSYADTFNLPVLIPRFVNIYGPGDKNLTRIIPKTIKSVIDNKNPEMWGGDNLRQYLYIDDAIKGYIELAELSEKKIEKNRIFNFGSTELISVNDLIRKIILISENNVKINKIDLQRENEIKKQYVSFTKARDILNWTPEYNIDLGLKKTFDWWIKRYK